MCESVIVLTLSIRQSFCYKQRDLEDEVPVQVYSRDDGSGGGVGVGWGGGHFPRFIVRGGTGGILHADILNLVTISLNFSKYI